MAQARSHRSQGAWACTLALCSVLLACQREAPGPEECARFAQAAVTHGYAPTPQMLARIDTTTRECLTRPYDRELLACVLAVRQVPPCWEEFRRRKGQPSERPAEP